MLYASSTRILSSVSAVQLPLDGIGRGADFDPSRNYRYRLWREIADAAGTVCFVMLNPSTADETTDDATQRRVCGFARDWGYGRAETVNLFAIRGADPRVIKDATEAGVDPIGPANDRAILSTAVRADLVVAAWGVHGSYRGRDRAIARFLVEHGVELRCLGKTRSGAPRHPLYVPKSARLVSWP
jgi:hypothetical protein